MHTHMYTTPFQQSCAYKPERNKKGARLPVAQLVFHELRPGDSSAVTSENCLLITMTNSPIKFNEQQPVKKRFITFSRVQSADHSRNVVYISIQLPLSHDWGGDVRRRVDSEWNILSILVVVLSPLRRKHLKSAKYGHFPENRVHQEPETANDMYPTPWERERKRRKRRKEGYQQQPCLIRPPFRGLCSVCIHDLCKVARTFPLNLATGSHFYVIQLKVWGSTRLLN